MTMRPLLRSAGLFAAVTALYYVAAKLGLQLAFFHPSATPVWPPTGIAMVAVLLLGYEVAPAILVGAFLVNLTTAGTPATSLGIACGNMLEAVCAAYLVSHYAGGRRALETPATVVRYALCAAVISPLIGATVGVTSLALGSAVIADEFGAVWVTWWLGDLGGALVLAPALLLWATDREIRWNRARALEALSLLAGLVLVSQFVFGAPLPLRAGNFPLEYLAVPLLVWAAYRYTPREAATAVVVLAALAVWGTLRGNGPFARPSPNESLLVLQVFLAVAASTTLMLAALVRERRDVEQRLRHLAGTDPLTGLANYRQLMAVLEVELLRSSRTGRPFALVMFDLDGLKEINDRHGHVVGSHALVRLAVALRSSHRAIDTAARYGGDEFALLLPETTAGPARRLAERVARHLSDDGELPALSVTMGVAVYPRDGDSLDALIASADRVMYERKNAKPLAG